jgi:outer membrane protein OmpA-like peptidoglycan-associated protein
MAGHLPASQIAKRMESFAVRLNVNKEHTLKSKATIIVMLVIFLAAATNAVEWNGKFGIGVRGPMIAPMFKGSSFSKFGSTFEPYMMGWSGTMDLKYGITRSFVLGLSGGYAMTFDNTLAASDQSFKLNKSDDAYSRLNGIMLGLTGQIYFLPGGNVQPYLLAGGGIDMWKLNTRMGDTTYSFNDFTGKFGAGINFWVGESFTIDIQGKMTYGLSNLSTSGDKTYYGDFADKKNRPFFGYLEPSMGFTFYFGGARDSDRDGVKDKFDQCPDTPLGAKVDQYGCPLDSDGDGVYDGIDQCLDTPKGCIVDIVGCPLDSDKDGVCDGLDKCPDTPVGVMVDVRGCPLDTDGDGIPDYKDKQPDTPKGAVVDENGVAIDSDGDGVPDGIDKCPDTPSGVAIDGFGCPKAKPLTEKLSLNIQYEPGSFEPDIPAKQTLDALAETMKAYPALKIQINGFTDALGSASGNLKLSQKRADAVLQYLKNLGLSPERMMAKGFGEDPKFFIGDNGTPEGRQKNRRIEIVPVAQ